MRVPLTIVDHIRRAELLYPDRIAVVDEPDQPAESWGSLTYRQVAERARAQAAGLDALGIAVGEARGDDLAQLGAPPDRLLRSLGIWTNFGSHQLSSGSRRGQVHHRAFRSAGVIGRPRT